MSDNVVPFVPKPKPIKVYRCAMCNCQQFSLHVDLTIHCYECDNVITELTINTVEGMAIGKDHE